MQRREFDSDVREKYCDIRHTTYDIVYLATFLVARGVSRRPQESHRTSMDDRWCSIGVPWITVYPGSYNTVGKIWKT